MNLVIGNSSQQSYFYPSDYIKIPSRNIDIESLSQNKFDSIYITFAEQRIYDKNIDYLTPNFTLTFDIVKKLIYNTKKIVVFGSCELWSNYTGTITIDNSFNFNSNPYCESKMKLIEEIKKMRIIDSEWNKVKIIYPFYFNSSYRSDYFLFGKIFDSIIKQKKIEIGNLDFYRDMIHTSFLVKKVMESESDLLVGSGRLFNVKDFIYNLYIEFGMKPDEFLLQNKNYKLNEKFIRPKVDWNYTYDDLMNDTIKDLKNKIKNDK